MLNQSVLKHHEQLVCFRILRLRKAVEMPGNRDIQGDYFVGGRDDAQTGFFVSATVHKVSLLRYHLLTTKESFKGFRCDEVYHIIYHFSIKAIAIYQFTMILFEARLGL